MNQLSNFFLSLILIVSYFLFFDLEFESSIDILLPSQSHKEIYAIASKFDRASSLVIYSKDKQKIQNSREFLLHLEGVEQMRFPILDAEYRNYLKEYKYYLQPYNAKDVSVKEYLSQQYQQMLHTPFAVSIDPYDPLGLFEDEIDFFLPFSFQDGILAQNEYYLSFFILNETDMAKFYEDIKDIDSAVEIFSPKFYHYENPQYIMNEINFIVLISIIILAFLYFYVIGNVKLLLNTFATLISSVFFSLIVLSFLYQTLSIFVIVFGVIICAVGIDYMFHHYLKGYYKQKKGVNKNVLYGFLTTFFTLLVLSFNPYTLIAQITLFASLSLLFSYIVFSFIYPTIGFRDSKERLDFDLQSKYKLKTKIAAMFALAVVAGTSLFVEFDTTIAQLDYDNKALKHKDQTIAQILQSGTKSSFLLSGNSFEELLQKADFLDANGFEVGLSQIVSQKEYEQRAMLFAQDLAKLHQEVVEAGTKIGFRQGYFDRSYSGDYFTKEYKEFLLEDLQRFGFDVIYDEGQYHYIFEHDLKNLEELEVLGAKNINFDHLFAQGFEEIYKVLLLQAAIVFLLIMAMLYFFSHNFLLSLLYILLPLALIALYGAFFGLNIMMVIATFAIVAICIDYGIYMANSPQKSTKKAILYSLLTTFAGFGVLIFSSVEAVYSLAIVALLGIFSILILLLG